MNADKYTDKYIILFETDGEDAIIIHRQDNIS